MRPSFQWENFSSRGEPQCGHLNVPVARPSLLPHSSGVTPQDVSQLLSTISSKPYEECEDDWKNFLRFVRLQMSLIPAVQMILRQGRWRGQPNPVAYIRKGAIRCAIRERMIDLSRSREVLASDLTYRDADGNLLPHDERLDMATVEYEEKFGGDDEDYYSSPLDRVSEVLVADDIAGVDWDRAADLAGLDAGERLVLDVRLVLGCSREQALSLCYTEGARKLLQAAWKRFERHQEALKKVLLSGVAHKSRRIRRVCPEEELELVFVEMQDHSLKISFQKVVPENDD